FSAPSTLNPKVVILPLLLSAYFSPDEMDVETEKPNVTYTKTFIWPDPKIKAEVNVPKWVPFLNGKTGIEETGVDLRFKGESKGEGRAGIAGTTALCVACGDDVKTSVKILGEIFGNGIFIIDALELVGGEVGVKVGAEIVKESDIGDVFPALKAAEKIWVVGRAVKWFNERAKLEAKFNPDVTGTFEIRQDDENPNCTKGLRCQGTIESSFPVLITLMVEIIEDISASAWGGATPTVVFGIPAQDGGMIELSSMKLLLTAGVKLTAWLWDWETSDKWVWTYPSIHWHKSSTGEWTWRGRNYGENYANFVGNSSEIITTKFNTTSQKLIENAYPLSNPEIAFNNANTVIVYSEDVLGKSDFQGEEIFALVQNNGVWSEAVNISNNNKMDFSPKIAFFNNKAIIAWTQQKEIYNSDPGLSKEFIQNFELAFAVFNPDSGIVESTGVITENDSADLNPSFVFNEGRLFLVWDQFNENSSKINFAEFSGSSFISPNQISKNNLFEKSVSFYNGNPFIALIEENELFFGEADKQLKQLSNDSFTDSSPKLLFFNNIALTGRGIIVWLKDQGKGKELFFSSITNGQAFKEEETGVFVQANQFELIEDNSGNAVVLWTEINENKPELFYSVYDRSTNNWSEEQFLTDSPALEEKFSAAFNTQNSLLISVLETEIELIQETDSFTGKDLEEDKMLENDERTFSNIPVPKEKNLILVTHSYSNDLLFSNKGVEFSKMPEAGKQILIKVWFKNSGDTALKNVKVQLFDESSGQSIETQTLKKVVKAGEERLVEFKWTPRKVFQNQKISIILDPLDEIAEAIESNNKLTANAFAPDIQILSLNVENINPNTAIMKVKLKNAGNISARKVNLQGTFSEFGELTDSRIMAESKSIYDLKPEEEIEVLVSWDHREFPDGLYSYYLSAYNEDLMDLNTEDNEENVLVEVLSNLTTKAGWVELKEKELALTIENNGARDSGKFELQIFDGTKEKRILLSKSIDSVPAGETIDLFFVLPEKPANNYFIFLDSKNSVIELYENDNLIENTLDGSIQGFIPLGPEKIIGGNGGNGDDDDNEPMIMGIQDVLVSAFIAAVILIAGIVLALKFKKGMKK
ncbi:hypothetical protein KKB11_01210, partial [Candidatus Micrarchaeota archaeon]|nr:hypothetical protein [Candidatus Micrarchaeota archaeon]